MMKHQQQQQNILFSLYALVAFLTFSMVSANATTATTTDDKAPVIKLDHLRSLHLRGGPENRPNDEMNRDDRDLNSWSMDEYFEQGVDEMDKFVKEYTSTLDLYQMDTSIWSPNTAGVGNVLVQQSLFDEVVSNGASGQLLYKESGWEFSYALTAWELPPDTTYELVLITPPSQAAAGDSSSSSSSSSAVTMTCLGSGTTTTRVGGLFIRGSVPVESSMVDPSTTGQSKQQGARVWLALASDVNCSSAGATAQMVQQETPPKYAMYLFPKSDEYIEFQYLGDNGQQV